MTTSQQARPAGRRLAAFDRERLRRLIVDANDGIIALAGLAEGFIGAGADTSTVLVAVLSGAVAGGIALGGAKYAEEAVERDALDVMLDEERRQLALSPEAELAELTAVYEDKGLSPELAAQVAVELTARDALRAHAEAEYGIEPNRPVRPVLAAVLAGLAFAAGALLIVPGLLATPTNTRVLTTFVAVTLSLSATSFVLARWGDVPVGRTMLRTVSVGIAAMLVSFGVGSLFEL